jgi:hypothetical protein
VQTKGSYQLKQGVAVVTGMLQAVQYLGGGSRRKHPGVRLIERTPQGPDLISGDGVVEHLGVANQHTEVEGGFGYIPTTETTIGHNLDRFIDALTQVRPGSPKTLIIIRGKVLPRYRVGKPDDGLWKRPRYLLPLPGPALVVRERLLTVERWQLWGNPKSCHFRFMH